MTVKDLIKKLVDYPMDMTVEIKAQFGNVNFSCSDDVKVVQTSDRCVLVTEME